MSKTKDHRALRIPGAENGRYEVEEVKNQEVGEERRRGSQFSAQPRAQPQTSGWAW